MKEYDEKLKPCPFCGGKATFRLETAQIYSGVSDYRLGVECINCGIHSPHTYAVKKMFRGGGFLTTQDERDKAVEAWNRRANDEAD